ncbi:WD domain, G-beta repeat protein [Dictyocaulus viviparus]|uniref:WD domain, G-beta repeat protein n=1 Tax=Dictyocaulus viviparus TaxID=29172 RepID=A0A0D8XC69_DICVI|nr:WD domain, G-beta repeat protein [Dictyocaulus viviparus]
MLSRESSSKFGFSDLLHKIEGHVARINDVILLSKEEGVWTASDDRSIRLYLKRDTEQFWPSIHKIMPVVPTRLLYSEETSRLFVGLLNGNVYEYLIADDYNSMGEPEVRRWTIHAGPISGLEVALSAELIFSCSKDKSVVWHCSETGIRRGPISALAWNGVKEILYSGSCDNLVIMWDIGGKRGEAYELNCHSSKITSLAVAPAAARLFSADDNGKLVCWDMSAERLETPGWKNADNCEVCCTPFFWNLTAMWQRKALSDNDNTTVEHVGKLSVEVVAQIGQCFHEWDTNCRCVYAAYVTRIWKKIHSSLSTCLQFFRTSLSVSHDLRSGVTAMHLQETQSKLVTASQNRVIMVWDIRCML